MFPWLLLGFVTQAAGSLLGGASQYSYGRRMYRLERERAHEQTLQTDFAVEQKTREENMMLGRTQAMTGTAGVAVTGSPLEVLADTAAQYEKEIQNVRRTGRLETRMSRLRGQGYAEQGTGGLTGGILGAGSSLLYGGYEYSQNRRLP